MILNWFYMVNINYKNLDLNKENSIYDYYCYEYVYKDLKKLLVYLLWYFKYKMYLMC